jgi:5-methylcytosine-specific restriction protein A
LAGWKESSKGSGASGVRTRVEVGAAASPNPPWEVDELLLALDLYLDNGLLDDTDSRVVELSGLLHRLPIHDSRPDAPRFRNPNGVAMKLGNFAALDPTYPGVGLRSGGHRDREVWERFSEDRLALKRLARALRDGVESGDLPDSPEDGEDAAREGRIAYRRHRQRERNRSLTRRKKQQAIALHGHLCCEACGLVPSSVYRASGDAAIECHHVRPLSNSGETRTRLADLALVCANCHRVIHHMAEEQSWPVFVSAFRPPPHSESTSDLGAAVIDGVAKGSSA